MFTGLVTDVGKIARISGSATKTYAIQTSYPMESLELGESIAVNGVCLTVTEFGGGMFSVDAGAETLDRTAMGKRKVGDKVHLERALRLGDRLGGHIVSGHVDAVGKVVRRENLDKSVLLEFEAPRVVSELVVEKGSITIDGVSLTVNTVNNHRFTVAIIPYTQEKSHLLDLRVGHEVNLESDILGKYVRRLLHVNDSGIDADFLSRYGFAVEKPHE